MSPFYDHTKKPLPDGPAMIALRNEVARLKALQPKAENTPLPAGFEWRDGKPIKDKPFSFFRRKP